MNKKMREILAKIKNLTAQAREKQDGGDVNGASEILAQISSLRTEYNNEKALFEVEKGAVPDDPKPTNKANGFTAMAKLALRKPLTEAENALITGGTDGENYLVPEDVELAIRERRKTYMSAKELTNVVPTKTLSGSFLYEKGSPAGLTDFTDGEEIETETNPQFEPKKWAIHNFGKIIPVSKILLGAEQAGLMGYLDRWFVKNSIISENAAIFASLKKDKTAKTYSGLVSLNSALNKELDPSALIGGVIVTNQSGFDIMDSELDKNGRPLLTVDLSNPTGKKFKGLPIKVFSDAQLPNETKGSPIFCGNILEGITFMEKKGLEFATSEHAFFGKNQLAIRVIEGFDVFQADADAYLYGLISAPAASESAPDKTPTK